MTHAEWMKMYRDSLVDSFKLNIKGEMEAVRGWVWIAHLVQKDVIISESEDNFPVLADKGMLDDRLLDLAEQVG